MISISLWELEATHEEKAPKQYLSSIILILMKVYFAIELSAVNCFSKEKEYFPRKRFERSSLTT